MTEASAAGGPVASLLRRYQPDGPGETADVQRLHELASTCDDPWLRSLPLHVTASALIVHPPSGQVLLRWHPRHQAWLQVGGHGDPGESDPLAIALREAAEETGLPDLVPWPDAQLREVVIVSVPATPAEPAHQHGDLRFVLATRSPGQIRPEQAEAPLRWLPAAEAPRAAEPGLATVLDRVRALLTAASSSGALGMPRPE